MTQLEAKNRLRNLINEATAGYYSDTQLYQFLDSGVHQVINLAIARLKEKRATSKYARSAILEPLHTLDASNTTTTTSGGVRTEYSLPNDYLMTDHAELDVDDRDAEYKYPCILIDFAQYRHNDFNSFLTFSAHAPAYYIRADKIGFCVDIAHGSANMYSHWYYKKHAEVTAGTSAQQIPINERAHDAVLRFALADALIMDDQPEVAEIHRKWATEMIQQVE